MNEPFDFDINEWFDGDHPLSPDEELSLFQELEAEENAEREEKEALKQCCGSCENFVSLMVEAGLCKLNNDKCLCKNPKTMIDMFDPKCSKWKEKL